MPSTLRDKMKATVDRVEGTVDRVEGKLAVLLIGDKGEFKLNVPISLLPEGSKEGDILDISIPKPGSP
jgi:Protein of unknown function (DUF3006)